MHDAACKSFYKHSWKTFHSLGELYCISTQVQCMVWAERLRTASVSAGAEHLIKRQHLQPAKGLAKIFFAVELCKNRSKELC